MRPVLVQCVAQLRITAERVGRYLLDTDDWETFRGWGLIPGIRSAKFRLRTDAVVGSQIEVVNTDGSTHTEEFAVWEPARFMLRMSEFSPPLRFFAAHFEETWVFEMHGAETRVVRSFALHPRNLAGSFLLRLIAPMLRRAVDRQLREMEQRTS